MEAIIFARVSTEDQKKEGYSIPAQIAKMREYCLRKGIKIGKEYEVDESSTIEERKKLNEVIEQIKLSKVKIALIVETVDRLQRGFKESVIFDDLRKQDKVEIHFLRENLVITKDSTSSEMIRWDMGVMFARSYVLQLSDNVKRSIQQKLRNGELIGKAPYGYKNERQENGKQNVVLDPFASNVVKKAFELYATGAFSMQTLMDKIKKDYGIKWSRGWTDAILKNPFYYGIMLVKGKEYKHRYAPLISKDLFDRVQSIKAGYNKKHCKFAGLPYVYRGMIRCAHCGLAVTPEKHKGHVYYHCTEHKGKHGTAWLREEAITEQLANLFKKIQVPESVVKEITESLKSVHSGKIAFRTEQVAHLNAEKEKYQKRIEALYVDKLDGRITESEYTYFHTGFRERVGNITAQLDLLQDAEDNYYITSKYLLELANKAHDLFLRSEAEEKRQILKLVLSNLELEGENLKFSLIKPFDTIFNFADCKLWRP